MIGVNSQGTEENVVKQLPTTEAAFVAADVVGAVVGGINCVPSYSSTVEAKAAQQDNRIKGPSPTQRRKGSPEIKTCNDVGFWISTREYRRQHGTHQHRQLSLCSGSQKSWRKVSKHLADNGDYRSLLFAPPPSDPPPITVSASKYEFSVSAAGGRLLTKR